METILNLNSLRRKMDLVPKLNQVKILIEDEQDSELSLEQKINILSILKFHNQDLINILESSIKNHKKTENDRNETADR